MSDSCVTIVWFRQDLRLTDNPALAAAVERGGAVVPVYVWAPQEEGDWPPGAAAKVWLHQSLTSLSEDLKKLGAPLIIRKGDSLRTLRELAETVGADAVYWNRRYEPAITQRDSTVKAKLKDAGLEAKSFNGSLLFEPWEVATKEGNPYQVFTPYYRSCLQLPEPEPALRKPTQLRSVKAQPASLTLDELALPPVIRWDKGILNAWAFGEKAAQARLKKFIKDAAEHYMEKRDFPDEDRTSRLSPYLHHGELSPRQVWHAVREAFARDGKLGKGPEGFLRELVWREFGYHLLYHFPHTPTQPLRERFRAFPWVDMRKGRHDLERWQQGRTGYPLVDAGMRQLWATGWMHNRVRMVVASFLVKDLLVSWVDGARWFWDTLVDADLASNTLGWQWAGGCGADAAPYFRVFNPVSQSRKFDASGAYIRNWVPELRSAEGNAVHEPWDHGMDGYADRLVDHAEARDRALAAYEQVKG